MHTSFKMVVVRLAFAAALLGGCAPAAQVPSQRTATPPPSPLRIELLYPGPDSVLDMGQSLRFIVRVSDLQGIAMMSDKVELNVVDAAGATQTQLLASPGEGDVYRSESWTVPHRTTPGAWRVHVEVGDGGSRGSADSTFTVQGSTSEYLLSHYGFWLNPPSLRGVQPILMAEKGDDLNGMIRWGATVAAQHVLPTVVVEIDWRQGKFDLTDAGAVHAFLAKEIGDLGFTPIRDLGPYERIQFKKWNAWRVGGRGQFQQDQVGWLVFYSPEIDRTYVLGTTLVLPPKGTTMETVLESFDVDPSVHASGVAPEPLPRLLPAPDLVSPAIGAEFEGIATPIELVWKPVEPLADGEYYEVNVDYNLGEGNPMMFFTTRETHLTLPDSLLLSPNCGVFNWSVTLVRGVPGADPRQHGTPLSYASLYWYFRWEPATAAQKSASASCPNAQF